MIRELKKNEISAFIDFGDSIYKDDPTYVPYMRGELKKDLKKLVFETGRYRALCSFDEKGHMNGRILLTVKKNKQLATEHCGYVSHFEVVNDPEVFGALMDGATALGREMGAEYLLGTFFPHDPDSRRGILVQGFGHSPMLFSSHNPSYYPALFENYGFRKLTDAFEYEYVEKAETVRMIQETAEKSIRENDFHIDRLDLGKLDRDLADVHRIMEIASTAVNFEAVLSMEELKKVFRQWKLFIDPEYALIARKNGDGSPIGFTFSVPDYYEVIRKMRGRTDLRGLFVFLKARRNIRGLRAVLQYIIPEYQHKGVSKALYNETRKAVERNGVTRISLGTIMEKNNASNGAITSLGGELSRVYRIYYKEIEK